MADFIVDGSVSRLFRSHSTVRQKLTKNDSPDDSRAQLQCERDMRGAPSSLR